MIRKHISQQISRIILSGFLSLSLAASSLTPLLASEVTPQLSVSENTPEDAPALLPETETTPAQPAESTPDAASTISITFYDTDGQTILYGPIEKDLSAVQVAPEKGRYIFDTIDASGASVAQPDGVSVLPGIHGGRLIEKWVRMSNSTRYAYTSLGSKVRLTQSDGFTPFYEEKDFPFNLEYNLDGGSLDNDTEEGIPEYFTVSSDPVTLPTPYKKGCHFDGWLVTNPSAGSAYGSVITAIPTGTYIDYTYGERNSVFTGYQLQATWTPIVVCKPSMVSVKNSKKGEVTVKTAPNADETEQVSYELCYSTNASFPKKTTHIVDMAQKTGYKLTNMPKGKTYYFKVRAYRYDERGEKIYSDYSDTLSVKITNGVAETGKISSKSAKLSADNVKIDSEKNLYVKATVSQRLKSYDDFYYLVSVDPNNGKVLKSVASSDKNKTVIFKTPVRTQDGVNLINGKYALAVKTSAKKYKLISSAFFIKNPEAAADYTAPYPVTKSKKGIQSLSSAPEDLGVTQKFSNFYLNSILADSSYGTKYVYNGKTYYFYEPYDLINTATACNKAGITYSVQIMMSWPGNGKYNCLLYGTKSNSSPTNLYAINASTTKSRELLEAAFSFLAECCSKEDCHVDNWILGNEVNIYKQWYYAGNTGREAFMENYANAFRILYNSVKSRSKNAHIFICTDHTWINRCGDWGAKPFMDSFNTQIKSMNKNIQWNLAYHAYPSILYIPTTWKDSYAPNSTNADFVSPKNLNILTSYVKKTYGKNTRIIISECGFTSAEGEANQAAALAYSFYKAQFDDMIDAFIIRTEKDAAGEKLTKLNGSVIEANFGLCTSDGKKRASYDVFKYMDTPKYKQYTSDCLKTIGASNWNSIIPGFSDKKLKSFPNR